MSQEAEFTQKTESLLQSLIRNEPAVLKSFTGDPEAFPEGNAFDVFMKEWTDLQMKHGPLVRAERRSFTERRKP